jgi:tetratricopeptide (TPR) repeat protein
MKASLTLFMLFSILCCHAQSDMETLKHQLDTASGRSRASILMEISKMNIPRDPEAILFYADQALSIGKTKKDNKIMARAYRNLGVGHAIMKKNEIARNYFDSSLAIYQKPGGDSIEMAGILDNIGNLYMYQSDYGKAADFKIKALRIKEKKGKKKPLCNSYVNLGILYAYSKYFEQSVMYSKKALALARELKDDELIASVCLNLASVMFEMKDLKSVKEYADECEKIAVRQNDHETLSGIYAITGNLNWLNKDFKQAELAFKKELEHAAQCSNAENLSSAYISLGKLTGQMGRYQEGLDYLQQAVDISREINSVSREVEAYAAMATVFEKQKKFDMALKYYKLTAETRDSILNETTNKHINELQQKYDSDKKDSEIALLNKDKALRVEEIARAQAETEKQKAVRNGFIAGFVLLLGIAIVAYRAYQSKQKANQIISLQKREVEAQRDLIEEKQKEILDSIYYARRIQSSLITSEKYIRMHLGRLQEHRG